VVWQEPVWRVRSGGNAGRRGLARVKGRRASATRTSWKDNIFGGLKLIRVVNDVLYPWDDLKLRSLIPLYIDPRLRKAYISSLKPRKVAPRIQNRVC
jgi:hypothetical protein